MNTKFSSIRYDKSWRFVFVVALNVCLLSSNIKAQSVSASFLVNAYVQCLSGNQFVFYNTTVGDGFSYRWDFGNNTYDTVANPVKSYTSSGNFNVTLVATKSNISYYFSRQIIVAPEPLISNITLQGTANGFSYTYISSSTIAAGNMQYMWDFGDSSSSSLINPVHTYKYTGTYDAKLNVVSDYGCTATKNYIATVGLEDSNVIIPTFTANHYKQCITGNSFAFDITNNLSNISNYWWDFGDGSSSYISNPIKTYSNAGTYTVKLSIVKNGITYTNEKRMTVGAVINANYDFVLTNDNGKYFFANLTSPALSSIQYYWNFGDGCDALDVHPTHQFYSGNYNIKLFAKDTLGCVDSVTKNVTIAANALTNIIANFAVNKDTQCLKSNQFLFTNHSTQSCNISYAWSFGDGSLSTENNPQKTYQNTGTYNVTLTVKAGTNQYFFTKKIIVRNEAIWIGAVSNRWNDTANWLCSFPSDSADIIIKKDGLYNPVLNAQAITIKNLIVENGATFSATNCDINIKGNVSNAGSINASTSSFNFNGNNKQTISGGLNVGKLISNNAAGIEILSSNNDTVNVYDVLTLKQGTLITNNKLTFKSTALNTARLDKVGINGNTGNIVGMVNIDRYFQNKRGWRFITSPIAANGNAANYSLNNTWQKFTNITGPSGIGFDFYSNFYQANFWSDSLNKWMSVANTYTNYIANNKTQFANIPYFFFVRGNRSVTGAYQSGEVTMAATGYLQTGNQTITFNNRKKGNYLFVGNPYAAPIDLALITASGITGNFYFYDPTLNETGAYVTVSNKGNGNWVITPASAQTDKILQSGQAVLVEVAGASGSITFTESAKTTQNNMSIFGGSATNNIDRLEVNLYRINTDSSKTLLDGAVTIFSNKYSKEVDADDSKKILNARDNIGFQNGSDILSIEARPFVNGEDSISIYTSGLVDSIQYAIEIISVYKDSSLQQMILKDSLLQSNANIALSGRSWYYFNTANNNNAARFSLYLKSNISTVTTTIKNLKAIQNGKAIKLNWQVDGAENNKEYNIEHATNGIDFTKIATVTSFTYNDNLNRKMGNNFYRITALNNNDIAVANAVVKTNFVEQTNAIQENYFTVYPNPTSGKITVEFSSKVAEDLQINIANSSTGKKIKTTFIKAKIGNNKLAVNLIDAKESINNGLYIVTIIGSQNNYPTQKIMLIKGE